MCCFPFHSILCQVEEETIEREKIKTKMKGKGIWTLAIEMKVLMIMERFLTL